jgi:hypothetical protein
MKIASKNLHFSLFYPKLCVATGQIFLTTSMGCLLPTKNAIDSHTFWLVGWLAGSLLATSSTAFPTSVSLSLNVEEFSAGMFAVDSRLLIWLCPIPA